MWNIIILMILIFLIRCISLIKSSFNIKKLKEKGAKEYGKINTIFLFISHSLFYTFSVFEAVFYKRNVNFYTYIGIVIFIFSTIILWIVISNLKEFWTTKIFIAPNHKLNKSPLFKYVKHPNYFLNMIPELFAVSFVCQAWLTLFIGLPIYLIFLINRIVQEERIMKEVFSDY